MRAHHLLLAAALAAWNGPVRADSIAIPNASFESPVTNFVSINIDDWQKDPQPPDFDGSQGYTWIQQAGLFKNTSPTSADHIDNCDGNQAIYMFANPEVALSQDLSAVYQAGKSYSFTIGVVGGGGGMKAGATFLLSLYYRDGSNNMVTVSSALLTNSLTTFPKTTHLVDCQVNTMIVKAGDPWVGHPIGVRLLSTVDRSLQGGYWDFDNARLTSDVSTDTPALPIWALAAMGALLAGIGAKTLSRQETAAVRLAA